MGTVASTVFPTGVGMNRNERDQYRASAGVPHGCGDEPLSSIFKSALAECSPRVWG